MSHLAILCHATPQVRDVYQAALDATGLEVEFALCNSPHKGLSAAYTRLAKEVEANEVGPTMVHKLCSYLGLRSPEQWESITLASFSAGYGLVREVLSEQASHHELTAVVGIDSWHSGFDPDGTAKDSQLGGLVQFMLAAKEGEKACWLGHSDVQTYSYASTTQVANEVRRLAGLENHSEPQKGARIRGFDVAVNPGTEHSRALTQWGPRWLAGAVKAASSIPASHLEKDKPSSSAGAPLGMRSLVVALSHLGVTEQDKPELVTWYHAAAERGGQNIGRYLNHRHAWCASFASRCMVESLQPGDVMPHRPRAAVRELWEDAIRLGTARGASLVRSGAYQLQPGDLLIMTRGGPAFGETAAAFAKSRGLGHVGRVEKAQGDTIYTVDGNKRDAVRRVSYSQDDPSLVGAIAYPGGAELDRWTPTDDELEGVIKLAQEQFTAAWLAGPDLARDAVGGKL